MSDQQIYKDDHELLHEEPEHDEEAREEVSDLEGASGTGSILGGTFDKKNENEVAEEVRQQREA